MVSLSAVQVPQYEPEAALTMFKSFITGSAPLYADRSEEVVGVNSIKIADH